MSVGSFNLKRESLLVGEKITLKLCYLRILAMEKLEFGKTGNMILVLGLKWKGTNYTKTVNKFIMNSWEVWGAVFVQLWFPFYEQSSFFPAGIWLDLSSNQEFSRDRLDYLIS